MLIHGAWHGAWCWRRLVPLLESQGHRVLAPDLPSMGSDTTHARLVSLESWARFVSHLIAQQSEPVILVGHSRGGIVISQAAELVPECIRRLVYVSAFLLPSGKSLADMARADPDSLLGANMIPAESGLTCTVRPEVLRDAFFGGCSEEDCATAIAQLGPEPVKALVTPLKLSAARFGSVPRAYVECTEDRAVTLASQRRMQAELPCDPVLTLASDHSPFFSNAGPLAEWLGKL